MFFVFSNVEFDDDRLELRRRGEVVNTGPSALRVLRALLHRAGQLVTTRELVADAWGGRAVADGVLTAAIGRLRRALDSGASKHILTVYGRGYRFVGPYRMYDVSPAVPCVVDRCSTPDTALVGRRGALSRLEQCVAEAILGHGRLCMLTGESGIGKTRLMESLHASCRRWSSPVAWAFGRASDEAEPLSLWLEPLRTIASASVRRNTVLHRYLSAIDRADSPPDLSSAEPEPGLDLPCSLRDYPFELVTQALATAAEETPWVVMLDDLHRADLASIAILAHLLGEIGHMRLVVVTALRPAIRGSSGLVSPLLSHVAGHRNTERIALERLRESDVSAYVSAKCRDSEGRLARAVYSKSEGHPFFMTELVRNLAADEYSGPELPRLPSVAFDIIRQRLSMLESETRRVLAVAAVIGRTFELSLLKVVLGKPATDVMSYIDEACAARLLIVQPGARTAFTFDLGLTRDVLYDDLEITERRLWHDRVAGAVAARVEQGQPIGPAVLVGHLHAALPTSDRRMAVRHGLAAAHGPAVASAGARNGT